MLGAETEESEHRREVGNVIRIMWGEKWLLGEVEDNRSYSVL